VNETISALNQLGREERPDGDHPAPAVVQVEGVDVLEEPISQRLWCHGRDLMVADDATAWLLR
jgi:hypothetical protein